jgi:hypothetical protein
MCIHASNSDSTSSFTKFIMRHIIAGKPVRLAHHHKPPRTQRVTNIRNSMVYYMKPVYAHKDQITILN